MELTEVPPVPEGYALAVHGGAGDRPRSLSTVELEPYHRGLREALRAGQVVLAAGGPALDAVCAAVVALEDDELFNAGRGAALTSGGTAELDAAVMTGAGSAGAVAGCTNVRNPVMAARAVMEQTPHVLLLDPAKDLVETWGLATVPPDWFVTERRVRDLARKGHADGTGQGTVGAVARDAAGAVAVATSTGGMTGQLPGRVGDTPIVGAGTYADAGTAAVSCTGAGEYFIRGVVAYDVTARMRYQEIGLADAVRATFGSALADPAGTGGLIAADASGGLVLAYNSTAMFRGHLGPDGEPATAV